MKLREALGFEHFSYAEDEDIESVFGDSLNNLPNLHIELEHSDEEQNSAPKTSKYKKTQKRAPLQPAELSKKYNRCNV